MRILAIGDIHGCSRALDALLEIVQPQRKDLIVTLGDYLDRGPDSFGVVERMLRLQCEQQLIPLRGNHEQMMLQARAEPDKITDWLCSGGKQALASYSVLGDAGKLVDVPEEHWDFLEKSCRLWFETDSHFFVHANAYPDLPLDEQPDYMLLWEFFNDPGPHCSGKTMVCGHTQQKSGVPRNLGHAVCIDTWVYGGGWLTCLEVQTGKVWQARQTGETRTALLVDCAFES